MQSRRRTSTAGRRGYTLIEMVIASALTTLLGILLAATWSMFGRPALDVEARARITREAMLAAEALAGDLSGYPPDAAGQQGSLKQGVFVDWMVPEPSKLRLDFHGVGAPEGVAQWGLPDRVITYQVQDVGTGRGRLVRWDETGGITTTIAEHVTALTVTPDPSYPNQVQIQITLSYPNYPNYRTFTATFVLVGVKPS